MLRNDRLAEWDQAHFMHPSTAHGAHARGDSPGRIMTGGEGVHVEDRDGHRLLDGFAGLYCVNVGYGRTKIIEAIAEQARSLAYHHAYVGHGTEASITLARMIAERAPEGLNHVYFGLGGSDANETNVKLVRYYNNVLGRPARKKIISRWRGYHGSGLVAGGPRHPADRRRGRHRIRPARHRLRLDPLRDAPGSRHHRQGADLGLRAAVGLDRVGSDVRGHHRTAFAPEAKVAAGVVARMLGEGVIARAMPEGDIVGLAPPMCLTRAEADVIVAAVSVAMEGVTGAR